jgi:hypothetical protein
LEVVKARLGLISPFHHLVLDPDQVYSGSESLEALTAAVDQAEHVFSELVTFHSGQAKHDNTPNEALQATKKG